MWFLFNHLPCIWIRSCASLSLARSFDIAAGEHPVKWLLDTLSVGDGILDAMWLWLEEVVPGKVANPVKVVSADSGFAKVSTGFHYL